MTQPILTRKTQRTLVICSALLLTGALPFTTTIAWADTAHPANASPFANAEETSHVATDSFVEGNLPVILTKYFNQAVVSLPTIIIQEKSIGALRAQAGGSLISLVIDDWFQFQENEIPTVTVSKADGTVLPGRISQPETSHFGSTVGLLASEKRTFDIRLLVASNAETGPYKISISGLKIKTTPVTNITDIPLGDHSLTVTGNSNRQPGGVLSAADLADGSNVGARPTQQSLPVVWIEVPMSYEPMPIVDGPITAQTITVFFTFVANDAGKRGAVYVFGHIPANVSLAPDTYWFFDANRNWHLFPDCTNAVPYYDGTLKDTEIPLPIVANPTDLTALISSEVYFGYGLGYSRMQTCQDMVLNNRYSKLFTVWGE